MAAPIVNIALFAEESVCKRGSLCIRKISISNEHSQKCIKMRVFKKNPKQIVIIDRRPVVGKLSMTFEKAMEAWFYVIRRFFGYHNDCDITIFNFTNSQNPQMIVDWLEINVPRMVTIRAGKFEFNVQGVITEQTKKPFVPLITKTDCFEKNRPIFLIQVMNNLFDSNAECMVRIAKCQFKTDYPRVMEDSYFATISRRVYSGQYEYLVRLPMSGTTHSYDTKCQAVEMVADIIRRSMVVPTDVVAVDLRLNDPTFNRHPLHNQFAFAIARKMQMRLTTWLTCVDSQKRFEQRHKNDLAAAQLPTRDEAEKQTASVAFKATIVDQPHGDSVIAIGDMFRDPNLSIFASFIPQVKIACLKGSKGVSYEIEICDTGLTEIRFKKTEVIKVLMGTMQLTAHSLGQKPLVFFEVPEEKMRSSKYSRLVRSCITFARKFQQELEDIVNESKMQQPSTSNPTRVLESTELPMLNMASIDPPLPTIVDGPRSISEVADAILTAMTAPSKAPIYPDQTRDKQQHFTTSVAHHKIDETDTAESIDITFLMTIQDPDYHYTRTHVRVVIFAGDGLIDLRNVQAIVPGNPTISKMFDLQADKGSSEFVDFVLNHIFDFDASYFQTLGEIIFEAKNSIDGSLRTKFASVWNSILFLLQGRYYKRLEENLGVPIADLKILRIPCDWDKPEEKLIKDVFETQIMTEVRPIIESEPELGFEVVFTLSFVDVRDMKEKHVEITLELPSLELQKAPKDNYTQVNCHFEKLGGIANQSAQFILTDGFSNKLIEYLQFNISNVVHGRFALRTEKHKWLDVAVYYPEMEVSCPGLIAQWKKIRDAIYVGYPGYTEEIDGPPEIPKVKSQDVNCDPRDDPNRTTITSMICFENTTNRSKGCLGTFNLEYTNQEEKRVRDAFHIVLPHHLENQAPFFISRVFYHSDPFDQSKKMDFTGFPFVDRYSETAVAFMIARINRLINSDAPRFWIDEESKDHNDLIEQHCPGMISVWHKIRDAVAHRSPQFSAFNQEQEDPKKDPPRVVITSQICFDDYANHSKGCLGTFSLEFTNQGENLKRHKFHIAIPHYSITPYSHFNARVYFNSDPDQKKDMDFMVFPFINRYSETAVSFLIDQIERLIPSDAVRSWINEERNYDLMERECPGITPVWHKIRDAIANHRSNFQELIKKEETKTIPAPEAEASTSIKESDENYLYCRISSSITPMFLNLPESGIVVKITIEDANQSDPAIKPFHFYLDIPSIEDQSKNPHSMVSIGDETYIKMKGPNAFCLKEGFSRRLVERMAELLYDTAFNQLCYDRLAEIYWHDNMVNYPDFEPTHQKMIENWGLMRNAIRAGLKKIYDINQMETARVKKILEIPNAHFSECMSEKLGTVTATYAGAHADCSSIRMDTWIHPTTIVQTPALDRGIKCLFVVSFIDHEKKIMKAHPFQVLLSAYDDKMHEFLKWSPVAFLDTTEFEDSKNTPILKSFLLDGNGFSTELVVELEKSIRKILTFVPKTNAKIEMICENHFKNYAMLEEKHPVIFKQWLKFRDVLQTLFIAD